MQSAIGSSKEEPMPSTGPGSQQNADSPGAADIGWTGKQMVLPEDDYKGDKSPYEAAGILSRLAFNWVSPLIAAGSKRQLDQEDLFPPAAEHKAAFLGDRLEKDWNDACRKAKEEGKPTPRVWKVALRPFWLSLTVAGLLLLVESGQRICQAIMIKYMIEFLQSNDHPASWRGYQLAATLGLGGVIYAVLHQQVFLLGYILGWQMRVATMTLVNRKLLRLSSESLAHTTTGHIINLMSNDVRRFDELCNFVHFGWCAPLELMIVAVLIGLELGWLPALVGTGCLIGLIPLQTMFGRYYAMRRRKTVALTDQRVKTTGEILNGILAVKMFAWEPAFTKAINAVRNKERSSVAKASRIKAFNEASFFVASSVIALVTFMTYRFTGHHLKPSSVFYTLTLLQLPRLWMCVFFPMAIEKASESVVTFARLQRFMELKEPTPKLSSGMTTFPEATVLSLKDAGFSWLGIDPSGDTEAVQRVKGGAAIKPRGPEINLRGVTFELQRGELLGVSGRVGSGKSTLLAALLGDLQVCKGEMNTNGTPRVAYAPQRPFIVAGSLRDNILFGAAFEKERYDAVVEACALVRDIAQLPQGDLTEIGERGVNLSGGQKARVGLARAAYAGADLVLLDDPLSAVDPAVGRHIFEKCICGPLMIAKARVLVTHQLQYMPRCDRVLLLRDGFQADLGTFEALQARVDFHGFVEEEAEDLAESPPVQQAPPAGADPATSAKPTALVSEEKRAIGTIGWRIYHEYAKNMGPGVALLITVLMFGGQALSCLGDWYLAYWSSHGDQTSSKRVGTYIGLVLATLVVSFVRAGCFFQGAIRASSKIHEGMLGAVLGSPLSFFYSNPVGRVLNRFSADQGIMDDMLPITTFNFLQVLFVSAGSLVMISIGVPWVALALLPTFVWFLHLRTVFVRTSRETKRLEAVTRSPVYAHFAAELQGLATVRAFSAQPRFEQTFRQKLDENGRGYFGWVVTARWLAFRLDMACAFVLFLAALLAVASRTLLTPALVGLALTYALQLTGIFQWMVRQSAEAENLFTGVERALEYTRLPPESTPKGDTKRPHQDWPQKGKIELKDLTVSYRPSLPPVLNQITVTIEGGHKCGIVGRTGAGKSTLMLTLFRLVEPTSGSLCIDGLDCLALRLEDLRRSVSAIPQDPVLFGSSVRFNLDPFGEYSDLQLWDALQAVQLKRKVELLKQGLDSSMAEFGENFSVGERQLCCLARAILQDSRILVMDEATANVDLETDAMIQRTLRGERFRESTVLIIAHRMDTIIDADSVLVLERGRAVEFGIPKDLLEIPDGMFTAMVKKTGPASEARLREMAIAAIKSR